MEDAPWIVRRSGFALMICAATWLAGAQEAAPPAAVGTSPAPAADSAPAAAAAAPVAQPAAALPAVVHCGKLSRVERVALPVAYIDLERAAAAGLLEAGTGGNDLTVQREPAMDTCFAVAVFELGRGRSLSKFDYRLDAGGKAYECLALGVGDSPFDPRRQKTSNEGEARLLFEVPASADTVHLIPALVTAIPMREVRSIAFGAPTAPPVPAPLATGAAATPAAAAPASPAAAPAPAATPATEEKPAKPAAIAADTGKPAAVPVAPPAEATKPAKAAAPAAKPADAPKPPPAKKDALDF